MSKKKVIIGIIAVVAVIIIAAFAFMIIGGRPVDPGNDETVYVNIVDGSTSDQIAEQLEKQGLIRSATVFKIKAKMGGDDSKFKSGAYAINKGMTTNHIIYLIANGKTAGKTFRVTEGQAIYKMAKELEDQEICTQSEFLHEVEKGKFDYPFMKMLPKGANRLEGFLWPDTYSIPVNGGAHEAIDMMLKGFEDNVYNKYKDEISNKKLDFYKTIVKASIIEREASFEEDKAKVSSVIDNRLAKDMFLQMDSILSYIHQEDKVIASYKDLEVDSDFNPYKNKGLPPGPICSPGAESINAAINPADTNYLFFVNSPKLDGSLTFCEDEKQFVKAKADFEKAYSDYLKKNKQ
jgi:UPF0755 protein